MSEFARLKNSEQFYKVKIDQQERQLHDLQMERQAMYQVIGAMITMNPDTVENGIRSITLDEHFIGQNYAIARVDNPETQTFKYIANIITEREEMP